MNSNIKRQNFLPIHYLSYSTTNRQYNTFTYSPLELKSALADERESSSWQELQTLSGLEDWAGSDTRLEEQPLHTTNPHFLYTNQNVNKHTKGLFHEVNIFFNVYNN